MGRSKQNFDSSAQSQPTPTAVPTPTPRADASLNIIKPAVERPELTAPAQQPDSSSSPARTRTPSSGSNETAKLIKEHDTVTGTRAVKLKDAIAIAKGIGSKLHVVHQDAIKTGMMHPGLAEARTHLFGDQNYPDSDDRSKGAVHFLALAQRYHNPEKMPIVKNGVQLTSTDSLAWDNLQKAGGKLVAAHRALLSATPAAADVSVSHPVKGISMNFTPDTELLHITTNPTPFRDKGKAPRGVTVGGQDVSTARVKTAIAQDTAIKSEKIGGKDVLREDLVSRAKQAIRGTKRVRKINKPGGKGPAPGQITPETSVFGDVEPGVAIPTKATRQTSTGARPVLNLPKDPKAISVESFGAGVEATNKPKKQPRTAPTEEKAMRRVEREGK